MKIAILGYSGSGKSTLARELGRIFGCPVLHLDQIHFLPGWVERDSAEMAAEMTKFLDENESWIIDGSYLRTLGPRRMAEADQILFLELPRLVCFRSVLMRRFRHRGGKPRADMAPGCPDKVDWEFARWVLWEGRTPQRQAQFQAILAQYPHKAKRFRSRRQVQEFLESCKKTAKTP